MADEDEDKEDAPPPPPPDPLAGCKELVEKGEYEKAIDALTLLIDPPKIEAPQPWDPPVKGKKIVVEEDGDEPPPPPKEPEALKDPAGWALRGYCQTACQFLDKSLSDYNQAIELGSTDPNVYCYRAMSFIHKQNDAAAMEEIGKSLGLDPNCAMAFVCRALVKMNKVQYDKALADCNKAVEFDANLGIAYAVRGKVLCYKGFDTEGLRDIEKAVELDPKNPAVHAMASQEQSKENQVDVAVENAIKATDLNYRNKAAKETLANLIAGMESQSEKRLKAINQRAKTM